MKSVVLEKILEIGTTRDDKSHPQPIYSPFFNVSFMGLIFGKMGDEYVIFAARRGGVLRKNVVSN